MVGSTALPVVRVVAVAGVLAHGGVLKGGALQVDVLNLRQGKALGGES